MRASRAEKFRIRAQQQAKAKAGAKAKAKADARAKARAEAAGQSGAAEDAPVRDIDAFRDELARRIHVIVGSRLRYWRQCPQGCCRRARACRAPQEDCSGAPPSEPLTPEQTAQVQARMLAAIAAFRPPSEAENDTRRLPTSRGGRRGIKKRPGKSGALR